MKLIYDTVKLLKNLKKFAPLTHIEILYFQHYQDYILIPLDY